MNNVYGSKLQLVPVNEMVDCLRVKQTDNDLELGAWVRVKRGKYGGDLGKVYRFLRKVVELAESDDTVIVKFVLIIRQKTDPKDATPGGKRKKGTAGIRDPQKFFNPSDIMK